MKVASFFSPPGALFFIDRPVLLTKSPIFRTQRSFPLFPFVRIWSFLLHPVPREIPLFFSSLELFPFRRFSATQQKKSLFFLSDGHNVLFSFSLLLLSSPRLVFRERCPSFFFSGVPSFLFRRLFDGVCLREDLFPFSPSSRMIDLVKFFFFPFFSPGS